MQKLEQNTKSMNQSLSSPATPSSQTSFKLTPAIRVLRSISKSIIFLLRLNGKNRFSNEFIQMLDPKMTVSLHNGGSLTFRTGHGRLLWRALEAEKMEPMLIKWLDTFSIDDCFYDVGANVGTYSLYASKRKVRTFSFEPEFNNTQTLYENIFLNQVQEYCTIVPVGLSNVTQTDVFFLKDISKGDALHNIGAPSRYLDGGKEVPFKLQILTARLDDLVQQYNLPLPTKLKIDVDGNELLVLEGALKTLEAVKELHIEFDDAVESHRIAKQLLAEHGFKVVNTEPIPTSRTNSMSNYLFARAG